MSESIRDKALRAVAEERVTVVRANERGIALDCVSSKPDPATLARATYRTLLYMRDGRIVRECSCPAPRRCYHLQVAELVWRPGPHGMSDR